MLYLLLPRLPGLRLSRSLFPEEDAIMELSSVDLKRCTLVRLGGRIDGSVAPELGSQLREIMDSGRYKIVINMSGVGYTSSAALRELINAWKSCRRWNRGDLRLAEVSPAVDKVLELTGLKTQIDTFTTEAEAVGSF
jgi:anti-sigma B factor antagonist